VAALTAGQTRARCHRLRQWRIPRPHPMRCQTPPGHVRSAACPPPHVQCPARTVRGTPTQRGFRAWRNLQVVAFSFDEGGLVAAQLNLFP
jgi:hypothetical protein